ncbi:MAG TPA: hypothetical protein VFS72_04430 [Agromyces sp.]|nr:hypothetical protein [Agromyces sp.]
MIRSMLDRSVAILLALALVGAAGLWRLISWDVEANSIRGMTIDSAEDERALQLMFVLPYLLSPAAASVLVAALIGLPIVVGNRYAAIVRARQDRPATEYS